MKIFYYLAALFRQVIMTATSRERLKEHFRTSLYTNAYYLAGTSVIGALFGFAFWLIAARFYTPEEVGLVSAIIAAIGLLAGLSDMGLQLGLMRFLPGAGNRAKEMMNFGFTLRFLASLVASFIFLAGLGLWSPALLFLHHHPAYLAAFVVFTLTFGVSQLLDAVFVAYRSARFTFFQNLVARALSLPLLVLLASFLGAAGIFGSWGIAVTISLGIALFAFLPRVVRGYFPTPQISKGVAKDIIPYSMGNYTINIVGGAPNWILPLMVVNILGAEATAYFFIAWTAGRMVYLIPSALGGSVFAEGSHDESRLLPDTRRALRLSVLLVLPLIALVFAFGDKLLLLFGAGYSESGTIVLWFLALSGLPISVNILYGNYLRVRKRLGVVMALNALWSGTILTLSYLLMHTWGLLGIGVAFLAGHILVSLVTIVYIIPKISKGVY